MNVRGGGGGGGGRSCQTGAADLGRSIQLRTYRRAESRWINGSGTPEEQPRFIFIQLVLVSHLPPCDIARARARAGGSSHLIVRAVATSRSLLVEG